MVAEDVKAKRAEGGDPGAVVSADGELVASLPTHDELHITDEVAAQLVSMSAATIDRRLAPAIAEVSVVGVDDTVIPGASVRFSWAA